jgi:hypothetical protein
MKQNLTQKPVFILLAILSVVPALQACKHKPDYKAIRQQVVDVHDSIMREDEVLMSDKAKLRGLGTPAGLKNLKLEMPALDTSDEKAKITTLTIQLDSVSNAMSDWMATFNPDAQGKNNEQAVAYFAAEKVKVMKLDSIYHSVLKKAGDHLKRFHLKADTVKVQPMKMKM